MSDHLTHIYLNPVRADRADDFEEFLADFVAPAVAAQRPQLVDRWQVLKATTPESGDPGVVTYAFIFEGGDLTDDWDLNVLLPPQYGQEEADRLLAAWATTFAPVRSWVAALRPDEDEAPQIGWTFTPATRETVDLDGPAGV